MINYMLIKWTTERKWTAAAAESLQSCPTLCDPIDGSPPGSPIPGILQARTLEWVAISFSNAWKWKVKVELCPTLTDPIDRSLPGSTIPGIFQARVLEWGAIAFSVSGLRSWERAPAWIPFSDSLQWTFAAAKSHQSCLTLCDPIDSSPQGSPVPGILLKRTLEWIAISFSNAQWPFRTIYFVATGGISFFLMAE